MSARNGVLEMEMQPAGSPVPVPIENGALAMFERLARDPNASVENIERLMALWERMEAKRSESAYNAAMAAAQGEMRPVVADAYNTQTRSKYASYEALDTALRPTYTKHGFGLSFDTSESPLPEHVRLVCKVTHIGGHGAVHHLDMPADGKGAKGGDVMTKTHAVGSALSYGMRYLLRMVFNIAIADDDGNKAGGKQSAPTPAGFDDWLDSLTATADEGSAKLEAMWKSSKNEYRAYLTKHDPMTWAKLKTKAGAVK